MDATRLHKAAHSISFPRKNHEQPRLEHFWLVPAMSGQLFGHLALDPPHII